MTLLANAIQHSVGQGLFYSCRVHCPAHPEPIDFVYDCGSKSKREYLEVAITDYHRLIARRGLDFLIISHFDADHVNGLDLLLDGSFPTRTVFLPYLSPMHRLVLGLRYPDEAAAYYEFLENPVTFLANRGVERIVYVTGGGPNEPERDPPFDDGPPPEGKKFEFFLRFREEYPPDESNLTSPPGSSVNVVSVTHHETIRAGFCWQLKFFNYEKFPAGAALIRTKADAVLHSGDSPELARWKMFIFGLLDAMGKTELNPAKVLEGLKQKSTRKRLRAAYSVISKDHNNVSLATWHGPAYHRRRVAESRWREGFYSNSRASAIQRLSFGGTLLTGDLGLGHDFPKFETHYTGLLERTGFLGVPHHGSRSSWDSRILPKIEERALCFISAGFSNSHGHPNLDVISDIDRSHPWVHGHEQCEVAMLVLDRWTDPHRGTIAI